MIYFKIKLRELFIDYLTSVKKMNDRIEKYPAKHFKNRIYTYEVKVKHICFFKCCYKTDVFLRNKFFKLGGTPAIL